jgi:hypothetical protein
VSPAPRAQSLPLPSCGSRSSFVLFQRRDFPSCRDLSLDLVSCSQISFCGPDFWFYACGCKPVSVSHGKLVFWSFSLCLILLGQPARRAGLRFRLQLLPRFSFLESPSRYRLTLPSSDLHFCLLPELILDPSFPAHASLSVHLCAICGSRCESKLSFLPIGPCHRR